MGAKKGNKNALKHGLYARHFTPESRLDLDAMPTDESLMELAALRLTAERALAMFQPQLDVDQKAKVILVCVTALEAAANVVSKLRLLSGDAPILQDLWTAIRQANKAQDWDDSL